MQTIEPTIQEEILTVLPSDYNKAMEVMCQLIANMMLSGDTPWDINMTFERIKLRLAEYEGT